MHRRFWSRQICNRNGTSLKHRLVNVKKIKKLYKSNKQLLAKYAKSVRKNWKSKSKSKSLRLKTQSYQKCGATHDRVYWTIKAVNLSLKANCFRILSKHQTLRLTVKTTKCHKKWVLYLFQYHLWSDQPEKIQTLFKPFGSLDIVYVEFCSICYCQYTIVQQLVAHIRF